MGNPFTEDEANSLEEKATADSNSTDNPFTEFNSDSSMLEELSTGASTGQSSDIPRQSIMVDSEDENDDLPEYEYTEYTAEDFADDEGDYSSNDDDGSGLEVDTVLTEPFALKDDDNYSMEEVPQQEGISYQDELEFDEIDSSFFRSRRPRTRTAR